MAVVSQRGRVTQLERCKTTIPALPAMLGKIRRPRHVVIEEGPIADWLWANLCDSANSFTICDPRWNHPIAKNSGKYDPVDAEKSAKLHRGGHVKPIQHPSIHRITRHQMDSWVHVFWLNGYSVASQEQVGSLEVSRHRFGTSSQRRWIYLWCRRCGIFDFCWAMFVRCNVRLAREMTDDS